MRQVVDNFDSTCAICQENYLQYTKVMYTPCQHAFHENCLIEWLKTKTENALRMKVRKTALKQECKIEDIGPTCPNCNASFMKAVPEEEMQAIDQMADIVNMLSGANFSELDSSRVVDPQEIELSNGLSEPPDSD